MILTSFANFVGVVSNTDGREYGPQYFIDCLNVYVDGGVVVNYPVKNKLTDLIKLGSSQYQKCYGIHSYSGSGVQTNALVLATNVGLIVLADEEIYNG